MTQQSLAQAPAEVISCLEQALGSNTVQDLKSGAVMPSQSVGDQMRQCFEKMGPPAGMPGGPAPGMPAAPGGQMNLENLPSEVAQCLKSTLGENIIEQIKSGQLQPGPEINEKVKSCFKQFGPRGPEAGVPGAGMPMPGPVGPGGPGGCKTPEECQAYCQSHPEECKGPIMGPTGFQAPQPPTGEFMKPPEGFQPPPGSQVPAMPPEGQPAPPPPEGTPPAPAPSSLLSPQSLMGLIFGISNLGFSR